ncbi:type II toxin-antitoxin system HicB family antitoxin [Oscillospiraceae bacterium HV4-5-C5C]|nr:type II toxin-antitoxin system HicB family antitoxin [Oscillospiraceae bacterium HV4-5-C5C]
MNNTIQYKGYIGSVELSEEDELIYGKVMGIRSLISYEGKTVNHLIEDFHGAVDDYLAMCEAEGRTPEVAYKGSFNIRISPELHKQLVIYATAHNMTLNRYIEETLEKSVASKTLCIL